VRWLAVLGTHNAGELDNASRRDTGAGSPVICSGESVTVPEIRKHDTYQLRLREPLAALLHYRLFFINLGNSSHSKANVIKENK